MFPSYNIEYTDLQRPYRDIVTELPPSKKQKKEELSGMSREIEKNLHVFEKRINVTAVCASYKVTGLIEKEIPCVTVFVLGKGKIPAGETDFNEFRGNYGGLFGNAEFDVVEGYFKLATSAKPVDASYALPLRGGVGIGVRGCDRPGTLGGFLEDKDGKRYILSNEHVLNPLTRTDGTNKAVHVASTSEPLLEDVDDICYNLSNRHNNVVDMDWQGTENIIEQPAQSDYDVMREEAKKVLDEYKEEEEEFKKELLASRQKGMTDPILVDLMQENKFELENAEARYEKIKKGEPRDVEKRVSGLEKNVLLADQNCSFFVDAALLS